MLTALQIAWRVLTHEKGRTALAICGIFIAILLVFVELGFFTAVPRGGMLVYDHLRFDLLLTSDQYVFQGEAGAFPRERLTQAGKVAGVTRATPIYFGGTQWQGADGGIRTDVFAIGFDPKARPFAVPDIDRQIEAVEKADTLLVDSATRPIFGPLQPGRQVVLGDRRMTIAGQYRLGTGFLGIGVVAMSEANFFKVFPQRRPEEASLGLIGLAPGEDAESVAASVRKALPKDVRVFTRGELAAHEEEYWTTRTSVGLIFGSGLIISCIVGAMVLYQTLATQITRHLPAFATLKAIGYSDLYLDGIVVLEALAVVAVAFAPAVLAALAVYAAARDATLLPIAMTATRLGAVLALTLVMSVASALLSVLGLRRADPADAF